MLCRVGEMNSSQDTKQIAHVDFVANPKRSVCLFLSLVETVYFMKL